MPGCLNPETYSFIHFFSCLLTYNSLWSTVQICRRWICPFEMDRIFPKLRCRRSHLLLRQAACSRHGVNRRVMSNSRIDSNRNKKIVTDNAAIKINFFSLIRVSNSIKIYRERKTGKKLVVSTHFLRLTYTKMNDLFYFIRFVIHSFDSIFTWVKYIQR